MKTGRNLKSALVVLLALMAGAPLARAAFTGNMVYDNSTSYQNAWLYSGFELGDQITLAGTDRYLVGFGFEYYGLNLTASAQARVRFYANDGPNGPSGYATPGTLLFDSGLFAIPNPSGADNRGTMNFYPADFVTGVQLALTQPLPDTLTWTVNFSGVNNANNELAGLTIYSPQSVGGNTTDYWQNQSADPQNPDWRLLTNPSGSVDFAAQFSAVPEPSSLALLLLGTAGLGGAIWRRRRHDRC
jgi:hypothetical protein